MSNSNEWTREPQPVDEATYEAMMISLDRHLAERDLHIFQRPLNAAHLLANAYGSRMIAMIPAPKIQDHPQYSAEYLVARCHLWYADRYGNAVKTCPEIGFFLMPLEHRVWRVRAPFFYGTADLYIDRRIGTEPKENVVSRKPISINILDCFEEMTPSYSNALTDDELEQIEAKFKIAFDALQLLDALDQTSPFSKQARIDYNHSVDALSSVDRAYGKARRDTATCAEKMMKGLLASRNIAFPRSHNLVELAKLVSSGCNLTVDLDVVARLHTAADVSYDKPVSRDEALAAHADLLLLLSGFMNQMFK